MVGGRVWSGLCLALALAGCSDAGAESNDPDPPVGSNREPTRRDIDCPSYLADTVDEGASVGFPVAVDTTWGGLPEAWHALPAGAELCGAVYFLDSAGKPQNTTGDLVSAMIRSPLWGEALRSHYDPILADAGCTFSDDRSEDGQTRLSWTCPSDAGSLAQTITDTSYNIYLLSGLLP
jgi:hypothetical protein